MRKCCCLLSICCPHFADKIDFFRAIGSEFSKLEHPSSNVVVVTGARPCPHEIRLPSDQSDCWQCSAGCLPRLPRSSYLLFRSPLLHDEQVQQTWRQVEEVPAELRQFSGHNLYQLCEASVARRLKSSGPRVRQRRLDDPLVRSCIDMFQKDAIRILIRLREALEDMSPSVVVHFSGRFHRDRCAAAVCEELRIPIVAVESSFHPGFVYWDESGRTGRSGRMGLNKQSQDHGSGVDDLMSGSRSLFSSRLHPHCHLKFPTRDSRKRVIFLGQVPYDASLVEEGGDFADQVESVQMVSRALSSLGGSEMFFRPHPKAPEVATQISQLGLPNVRVNASLNEVNLDQALAEADCLVTVCSQSGLQAAWLGKTVVVLGDAYYSGKGFTFDAHGHANDLHGLLTNALQHFGRSPSQEECCRRYLAYLKSACMIEVADPRAAAQRLNRLCRTQCT